MLVVGIYRKYCLMDFFFFEGGGGGWEVWQSAVCR